jgi:hypothetical protein
LRPEEASGRPVGGKDYPRNLAEFEAFFSNDRDCAFYLMHLRWPDGFRCPSCGFDGYWYRKDKLFQCRQCRHKTSVTAGTLFDKSQLGLLKWFKAIWYVVNQTNGVSALGLQRVLGFGSYQTAWAWLQKLRRAMEPTSGKLRGKVEVDEIVIGGNEPGVTGRQMFTKSKVVVAVEHRGRYGYAGRVRMRRIEKFGREELMQFIQDVVEPGSTIMTDGWPTYKNVTKLGYTHEAYNVSKSGKQAHELLPAVHRVAALVKRWLLGTHQGSVAPSHLDYYLDEFCFRFNRRKSGHRGLLFHNLVKQAANTPPKPYFDLLSDMAGARHSAKAKADRKRRAKGKLKPAPNVPRARPKRPGGARTRLDGEAVRARRRLPAGRRAPKRATR